MMEQRTALCARIGGLGTAVSARSRRVGTLHCACVDVWVRAGRGGERTSLDSALSAPRPAPSAEPP